MKKLLVFILLISVTCLVVIVNTTPSLGSRSPLTNAELNALSGAGFWRCLITAFASSAVVVAAGGLTVGTGGVLVASVLAAGTLGVAATRAACTE